MLTSRYPKPRSCQQINRSFEEIFAANERSLFDNCLQHPLAYEWDISNCLFVLYFIADK